MNTIGIIPARLHSTRFPKKILHPIEGKPMVAHVYEQAKKSKSLNDLIVAIDSKETAEALKKLKIKYVMTSNGHVSGTDRVQEAVSEKDVEIVVNIQADVPSIDPNLIVILVAEFEN